MSEEKNLNEKELNDEELDKVAGGLWRCSTSNDKVAFGIDTSPNITCSKCESTFKKSEIKDGKCPICSTPIPSAIALADKIFKGGR